MQNFKSDSLISSVMEDLGIHPNKSESESYFLDRLLLSAASAWMHWIVHSNQGWLSITKLNQEMMDHLSCLYSAVGNAGHPNLESIIEYVRTVLLQNGDLYHSDLYVRPALCRRIPVQNVTIIRGMEPDADVRFSGLAPYTCFADTPVALHTVFDLPEDSPSTILDFAWENAPSVDLDGSHLPEYLQADMRKGKQYYGPIRPVTDGLVLGRRDSGFHQYDYYLLKGTVVKRIPSDWKTAGLHEYCRLALMNRHSNQPTLSVNFGETVCVQPAYLLPTRELSFLRYISWPSKLSDLRSPWSFHTSAELWPTIRARFEFLGLKVKEHE